MIFKNIIMPGIKWTKTEIQSLNELSHKHKGNWDEIMSEYKILCNRNEWTRKSKISCQHKLSSTGKTVRTQNAITSHEESTIKQIFVTTKQWTKIEHAMYIKQMNKRRKSNQYTRSIASVRNYLNRWNLINKKVVRNYDGISPSDMAFLLGELADSTRTKMEIYKHVSEKIQVNERVLRREYMKYQNVNSDEETE